MVHPVQPMLTSPAFIRSLLLASTFSFAIPIGLIGATLITLSLLKQIVGMAAIAQLGSDQLLEFLAVFGSGDAVQGALTIGLACGIVGALFDTYAFLHCQRFRDS
jgi:putative effector of murein hydrolase LrgA (UPF0299 family)